MKILMSITAGVLLALAPVASANTIQVQYQVGTGPITTCSATAPGPVTCSDAAGPPLNIVGLGADSNSPGTLQGGSASGIAVLTSAETDLINNSTSSQTLQIEISVNDFTAPVGLNASLLSHVAGTVITTGGNAGSDLLSFESCIDPSNALASVVTSVTCPPGASASGISGPSISAVGSFQNDKSATRASLFGPYSIDESIVITLAPGAEINWSASSSVGASSVPEPASSMLFLGAGLVGLGAFSRKRFSGK